ncbi:MAG: ThiF family adenylyltransferase [Armatimonadota bacterium]
MRLSWISLHPEWYESERQRLNRHYPDLQVDEDELGEGRLALYGEMVVRPRGGPKAYPIALIYPPGTPFEHPFVAPLQALPARDQGGSFAKPLRPQFHDRRHQMAGGGLCLFQRETRSSQMVTGIDVLRRAEKWFLGLHTGHWPPDTETGELEEHYTCLGDVLVAESLFSPDLDGGHGCMFLAEDLRRAWRTQPGQMPPLIFAGVTDESGAVVRIVDARADLACLYPWIVRAPWDLVSASAPRTAAQSAQNLHTHTGYWWALSEEPLPFRTGEGLLQVLSEQVGGSDAWPAVSRMLGPNATRAEMHVIGLRYPTREDGYAWLILGVQGMCAKAGGSRTPDEAQKRRLFAASPVEGAFRSHCTAPAALRLRNQGVINESVIGHKTVALIGLGALGSKVAEMLAQAGIGKLKLCDPDALSIGNVARHIGGVTDFGARKVQVVANRLHEINPYLAFGEGEIVADSATADLDRLSEFLESADLTVSTIADEDAESVLNEIAQVQQKSVLYGRSLRRASMGRVFLVRPGLDACKQCLAWCAESGRTGEQVPDGWIDVREDEEEVLLHECGRPVIAGSAIDLSFTASLVARVALDYLEGKDGGTNHWLWTQSPAGEIDPRLAAPMATFATHIAPHAGCRTCQQPEVSELVLSSEARRVILSLAEQSPDVETGGVLIGFRGRNGKAVAVRATGPGPHAVKTATRFHRDVEHVQAELGRAAAELGDRGMYIGEWHSHLTPFPQPSSTDTNSLSEIAEAPNYLTRCPVMVIAGRDPVSGTVAAVRSWAFPIGGRFARTRIRVLSTNRAMGLTPQ